MRIKVISYIRKNLTKADLVLICFLALCTLLSFSIWFRGGSGRTVQIIVDGHLVKELTLSAAMEELVMQGVKGPFSVEIKDGRVRMKDSTCPNKLCVKMGWIRHEGQVVCCIPNRIVLKITGKRESYDALAR